MNLSNNTKDVSAAFTAFAIAQGQFEAALKDANNPFFKSKYADLSSIWKAVSGPLSANGLSVMQPIRTTDSGSFLIETIVRYKDGTVIESCECPVIAKTSDAQALGSAITYARRYSLASILCIVTDDDDAESASDRPNNQRQPYERQAPAGQARHQQRTPAQQNVDAVSQPAEQVIAAVPVQASAPKIKKKELAELTKALTDWGNNVDVLMNDPGRRHNPEAYQIARTALIQFNGHMPVEDLRKYMQHLTDAAFENGIGYDGPTKKFYAAEPEMAEATNEELSQALADNE